MICISPWFLSDRISWKQAFNTFSISFHLWLFYHKSDHFSKENYYYFWLHVLHTTPITFFLLKIHLCVVYIMPSDLSCKKIVCESIFAQLFLHLLFFRTYVIPKKKMNFLSQKSNQFSSIRHVFLLPSSSKQPPTSFLSLEDKKNREKTGSSPSHQNNRSWVKVAEWKKKLFYHVNAFWWLQWQGKMVMM